MVELTVRELLDWAFGLLSFSFAMILKASTIATELPGMRCALHTFCGSSLPCVHSAFDPVCSHESHAFPGDSPPAGGGGGLAKSSAQERADGKRI